MPVDPDGLIDAYAAGQLLEVAASTVHGWAQQGWLRRRGREVSWPHRTLYRYGDVFAVAEAKRRGEPVKPDNAPVHIGCLVPRRNGRDCGEPIPEDAPVPMCMHHLQLAADFVVNLWERMFGETAAAVAGRRQGESCVYYMRRGELVKIGTTRHLRERVLAQLPDELLATEPGDYQLETLRLRQFRASRARGREWFRPSDELLSHIDMLRQHYGEPPPLGSA